MKQYDKYKLSNIRWVEQIPNEWKVIRNKNLFKVVKEVVGKSVNDFKILSLTLNGVIYRDLENKVGKMPKDFEGYQIVKPEDIVLCLFDMDVTPRIVGYSDKQGLVSSAYTVIKAKDKTVNPQYYYYWFLAMDNNKALLAETKGLRNTIKDSDFMSLISASPSIEEQNTIVDTLHIKLKETEDFIKRKQKSIELLKEYKLSKINELVTKGLNPNVKMKDSGIEWLREIPENWEVIKIKHIANVLTGKTPPTEVRKYYEGDLEVNWVTPSDFTGDEITQSSKLLNMAVVLDNVIPLYQENSVLLIGIGGTIGKVSVARLKGSCNQQINAIECNTKKVIPEFLMFQMRHIGNTITEWANYTTLPILTKEDTRNLRVALPSSLEEQKTIIEEAQRLSSRIETIIETAKSQIDLIQQYRQSLIYELVTGKRKP